MVEDARKSAESQLAEASEKASANRVQVLKKTQEEILKMAVDSVKYAKKKVSDIEFSPEDASRTERTFLFRILEEVKSNPKLKIKLTPQSREQIRTLRDVATFLRETPMTSGLNSPSAAIRSDRIWVSFRLICLTEWPASSTEAAIQAMPRVQLM